MNLTMFRGFIRGRGGAAMMLVSAAVLALFPANLEAAALKPRAVHRKPAHVVLGPQHNPLAVDVKFRDGLTVRLRDGRLSDLGNGDLRQALPVLDALVEIPGARWRRAAQVNEDRLDELWRHAQDNLGRAMMNPNLIYRLMLPEGADAAAVIDQLNALDGVEIAQAPPRQAPPPLPPNFQPTQIYLDAAPPGIGAVPTWTIQGVRGAGVKVADIEYSWLLSHQDLPDVTDVGGTPALTEPANQHHGCAALGIVGAIGNGWGTTGIAPEAELLVASSWTLEEGDALSSAILAAANALGPGDVIMLEAQVYGDPGPGGLSPLLPVEWYDINYFAIGIAVGNGIVVVEAAANGHPTAGGVMLDDHFIDDPPFFVHAPFAPGNDSGALIVGAGAAPPPYGSQPDLTRLGFSNYGSTVDLQGWGQGVRTTGYGDLYSAMGTSYFYTAGFGGTSSATPIVAGAAALLQSAHIAARGTPLTPAQVRSALRAAGTPQPSGDAGQPAQNIGPRPDAEAAILSILDCNGNGVMDSIDIAEDPSLDCNRNGLPDECDLGPVQYQSDELFPIGAGFAQSFTIAAPPAAGEDVALQFLAVSDLGFSSENIAIEINGEAAGIVFQAGGSDCAAVPNQETLMIPASTWNAAATGGEVVIDMLPAPGVDAALCPGGSHITVKVSYARAESLDADDDGVLDECRAPTDPADLNGDGQVNGFDLALLLGAWGDCPPKAPPGNCPADLDGNGFVNGFDLAILLGAWG